MAKFKPLVDSSVKDAESQVSEYWKQINILDRTLEKGQNDPSFVFYEGPPTANGNPGIHHVVARTLKDWVCRYKTMSGYQVKRKAGWDTHGLPVELQVEKELGLTNKQQIEEYGIAEFNQKCRESVFTYENKWRNMTERMAYEVDLDNPYITLDNNYIESVWWILDKFNKEGYLYDEILSYLKKFFKNAKFYEEFKRGNIIGNKHKMSTFSESLVGYLMMFTGYKTAEYFKCCNKVISRILHKNNIKVLHNNNIQNLTKEHCFKENEKIKAVKIIELNKDFPSLKECAQWLIDNNYSKANSMEMARKSLSRALTGERKSYCKLHFKYL